MEGGYYDEIRTTNLQALVEKKTQKPLVFVSSWIRRRVDVFNLKMVGVRASETSHFEAVNGNLKISWFPLRPKRYCITSSRRRSYFRNFHTHMAWRIPSFQHTSIATTKKKSTPKTNHPKKLMFWLRCKKNLLKIGKNRFPPWTRPALHEWHDEWYLEDLPSRVVPGEGAQPKPLFASGILENRSKKY